MSTNDLFAAGSSAVVSACGHYRYRLEREVQASGLVIAYFGINPSTADATIDDATVRKWRGFSRVNGGRRFIVGNVFSFRSTDVAALALCAAPKGPEHDRHLDEIIRDADVLVPCWGSTLKVPRALRGECEALLQKLLSTGKPVLHFGCTAAGDPKHPLMLGYDTPLSPWLGH
jgi:hypothetical protein